MEKRDAGDLQDMDTLKVMKTCSKWAKRPTYAHRLPEYVSMAFRHAMDSTPGPVYLEIPTNLLWKEVEEDEDTGVPLYLGDTSANKWTLVHGIAPRLACCQLRQQVR